MNPLLLLSLLGGGLFWFMKKGSTTPYIPPVAPSNVTPTVYYAGPSGPPGDQLHPGNWGTIVDGSAWSISSNTVVDNGYQKRRVYSPSGSLFLVRTIDVASVGNDLFVFIDRNNVIKNPQILLDMVSPSASQPTPQTQAPWSESHSPDQSPPSVAVPTMQQVITSSLPGLVNQLQQLGVQTQAQPYTVLASGPNPTPQSQIPTLPMLPAGLPSIANLSSSQLRGVATQISALGQTVLAQQLNQYADMMDSTGQKTVYVTPNPNAPVTSNW